MASPTASPMSPVRRRFSVCSRVTEAARALPHQHVTHERMTTMRWTRLAAPFVIACVTVLGACGGGSTEQTAPGTPPASSRRIHGQVAKGPMRAAHVRLYAMDGKGERASDTPVAQAVTA